MAFSVPSAIQAFFSKYPNALDVYVDEDGKSYLNHYADKALTDAKIAGKKLYQIDKNLTATQVYPVLVLKTYIGTNTAGAFTKCHCNSTTVNIPGEVTDPNNIEAAMVEACNIENVTIELIDTAVEGPNIVMTIMTYDTAIFKIGDTELVLQS